MDTSRIFRISAGASVGLWGAKSVVIALWGGLDRSPLEGPLFLLGAAAWLVAIVTLPLALTCGRQWPARLGAVIGVVGAGGVTSWLLALLIAALTPADAGWVWSEVNLWLVAVLLLLAGIALLPPRADQRAGERPGAPRTAHRDPGRPGRPGSPAAATVQDQVE